MWAAVSKIERTPLVFVDPGVNVDPEYCLKFILSTQAAMSNFV